MTSQGRASQDTAPLRQRAPVSQAGRAISRPGRRSSHGLVRSTRPGKQTAGNEDRGRCYSLNLKGRSAICTGAQGQTPQEIDGAEERRCVVAELGVPCHAYRALPANGGTAEASGLLAGWSRPASSCQTLPVMGISATAASSGSLERQRHRLLERGASGDSGI
ncbi:hypothetical protein OBBRIDRAFT_187728 [Obba rivulosa]|uniref:Uncharacterized protein n=1 Tax=Obba rivulosa TaxID=1052685 RepID=A0A8E2ALR5_9APHY|nr:hypothetical protein OBBRIDRAFT_187728 [Obba rivulosa]